MKRDTLETLIAVSVGLFLAYLCLSTYWAIGKRQQPSNAPVLLKCDRVLNYEDGSQACLLQVKDGTDPGTQTTKAAGINT